MNAPLTPTGIRDLLDANPIVGELRTGHRRFWTGREEKILREVYPNGGVPTCLPLLAGRTATAIYQRANILGLASSPSKKAGVPRQRWRSSPQIDAIIQRVYQSTPEKNDIQRLAQVVGRPRWWVSKRAQALGFVAPRFAPLPWSEAEDAFIAERAAVSAPNIRHQMARRGWHRTATAIVVRLKVLGQATGRNADDNHYTATGLAKLMGVDAKTVTRWIDKGWLKARRRGTGRVAAQGGDEHWVRRRDARAFIIENAAAVDLRKVEKFWFIDLLADGSTAASPQHRAADIEEAA